MENKSLLLNSSKIFRENNLDLVSGKVDFTRFFQRSESKYPKFPQCVSNRLVITGIVSHAFLANIS